MSQARFAEFQRRHDLGAKLARFMARMTKAARCLPHAELDRAIYHDACLAVADISRFTGNLSRISDPANRRKTAALLRDAFTQLAQDMERVIAAAGR